MKLLHFQRFEVLEGFLFALGVALLPIYVFKSGGVQPSHMVLALFALIALCRWGLPSEVWVFCLAGVSFYSFFLEGFYVTTGAKATSLMASVFFFYNLFLASAVYSFSRRYGLSAFTPGVFVACAIAIVAVSVGGISLQEAGQGRATGAFNNPNQLGYFSVCMLSLTYLLYSQGHLKYLVAVGMFSVAVFLSVASLSKAAMIANFVVVFLALKPVRKKRAFKSKLLTIGIPVFWLSVVFLGIIFIATSYLQGSLDDYLFVKRLQGMSQEADSSLASRGYFAFLEGTTIQFFLGLGTEGVADIVGHEVHSTLASVLNNYGVIGFILFSGVLVTWALKLWRAVGFIPMACLTGPAMLYGITHNGTRFTAFWILFATSMAVADRVIKERKPRQRFRVSPLVTE
ncbi:O-antigen ligase family protein [Marinobacter sp.]|uniref:O-antigen ligase family protein n=1 Tax=Marinobacter sp. TaxID=50741 RepID=UPI003A90ED47